MIPNSKNPKCPELEVRSKVRKPFKKHNPIEEYSVKNYEIDAIFINIMKKKNTS